MARYTGPVCKLCRRERIKLFLKGERCITDRCALERRSYPPGEHGRRRRKETEYMIQLREKQKARRVYGVMEKQFRSYYKKAVRQKGRTGENLIRLLESRLDNVVYRTGFANSRAHARQLVNHGHIEVNGRKLNISSAQVREGDVISVIEKSKKMPEVAQAVESSSYREPVPWLEVDKKKREAKVVETPYGQTVEVPLVDKYIVELYSK